MLKLNNPIVKTLLGLAIVIAISVGLLQVDDDLEVEAEQYLSLAEPEKSSDAYLYLLGIMADKGDSPLVYGKEIFKEVRKAEEDYFKSGDVPNPYSYPYPEDTNIEKPVGNNICSSWNSDCFEQRFSKTYDLDALLKKHKTLMGRYIKLMSMNDYHTLTKSSYFEPFPNYLYVVQISQLYILKAINKANNNDVNAAFNVLIDNIALLRNQLKQVDTLLGKLIYLLQISDNLDVLSIIMNEATYVPNYTFELLSLEERDFSVLMPREFALQYDFMRLGMYANESGLVNWPDWMQKTVLKRNMTMNALYRNQKRTVELARLTQIDFSKAMNHSSSSYIETSYVRNVMGSMLNKISEPQYNQSVGQLFDLNAKIILMNAIISNGANEIKPQNIQNPYYPNGETAYFSEDKKSLCLNGPLKDSRMLRCLRIKR